MNIRPYYPDDEEKSSLSPFSPWRKRGQATFLLHRSGPYGH